MKTARWVKRGRTERDERRAHVDFELAPQVLIKDVKSSNGTFIDGQRLSAEAAESDVFELRTGSTVVSLTSLFASFDSLAHFFAPRLCTSLRSLVSTLSAMTPRPSCTTRWRPRSTSS